MKKFSQLAFPYVVWVILMILLPMLLILFYSLTTQGNEIVNFTFTLNNYIRFLPTMIFDDFMAFFGNSL